MNWILLVVAGVMESGWALLLKMSNGFSRPLPGVAALAVGAVSFLLLSRAATGIPVGTAYAIWTGIGTVCTAAAGIMFFHEPITVLRLASIGLVLAGIVGLRLAGAE